MQKLKTFFRTLTQSVTSLTYYKDVVKAPLSFSFKYFFVFVFFLTLITTAIMGYVISREIPPIIDRGVQYAENFYPDDLVFTIKEGKLSVNREEPFVVPAPVELLMEKPAAIPDSERINLFVYDSSAKLVDFDDYNTLVLATDQVIMARDDNQGIRSFPLKEADDMVIDKQMVDEIVSKITPYTRYIVPILISFMFFVLLIFMPISKLVPLIFMSFIVLVVGRLLMGLKLSYSKYYQIGLHSITLPSLVEGAFFIFNINRPFGGFFTTFFLLYTLIILSHIKDEVK